MENLKKINGKLMNLDEAVNENNRLIWSIAYKYIKRGTSFGLQVQDLYGICSIGFIKAFNHFDPDTYNVKFSTYAVPKMIGEMQRYFRDNAGDVKFPRRIVTLANKISRENLYEETPELLSLHFDITIEEAEEVLEYFRTRNARSTEERAFTSDGEDITLGDQLGDKKMFDHTEIDVNLFLESLKPRDRKMIELVMIDKTQYEIGDELGISQVQVSRLLKQLYPTVEKFFGYPVGYFAERKKINLSEERVGMAKKKVKREAKGDLEKAKELLASDPKRSPCSIAKETGCTDASVYYWAKKIRNPESQENPVTTSFSSPIVIKDEFDVEEVAKELDKISKQKPVVVTKEAKTENVEFGIPNNNITEDIEKREDEIKLQEEYMEAREASERAEEYRLSLLRKANINFGYNIATNEVSPSDLHTLFTQAGHAAASSGLEKLNVSVIISSENITAY